MLLLYYMHQVFLVIAAKGKPKRNTSNLNNNNHILCKGETKRKGEKEKTAVKVGISPPSFSFPLCTPLP